MTVTDIEIGHGRPARSPDTRAAIKYLEASGATAITIVGNCGDSAFNYCPAGAIPEILDFPN
jgi:hypothetical protein